RLGRGKGYCRLKPPNASFEACKPPVWSLHSPGNQHQGIITAGTSLPHLLHRSQRMMSANVRQCPPTIHRNVIPLHRQTTPILFH
ncbi:MAG: hypothetical protein K2I98_08200, partial [Prevotella sp.]|nr:hypothetical protein [Prevotella sp.]